MNHPTAHLDPLKLEATPEALAADAELVQLYQQFVEQTEALAAYGRQENEYAAKFNAHQMPPEPPLPEVMKSVYAPDNPRGMTVAEFEASYLVHKRHKGEEWADNWRREVKEATAEYNAACEARRDARAEAYRRCFPEGFHEEADAAWDAVEDTQQKIKATHAQSALGLLIKLQVWSTDLPPEDSDQDYCPVLSVMADAARIVSAAPTTGLVAAE